MFKCMWILIEGRDDRRFADAVLRPILAGNYDHIDTWEYAQETRKKIVQFLRSLESMNADYLFLSDIDDSPCVTAKLETLRRKYGSDVKRFDAVVVIREIESWYLAGVSDQASQELGLGRRSRTDDVTKEQFGKLVPKRFNDSIVDFMAEILKNFRVDMARGKNGSFCYMMDLLERKSRGA